MRLLAQQDGCFRRDPLSGTSASYKARRVVVAHCLCITKSLQQRIGLENDILDALYTKKKEVEEETVGKEKGHAIDNIEARRDQNLYENSIFRVPTTIVLNSS